MVLQEKRNFLIDNEELDAEAVLFECPAYDRSIVGVDTTGRAVYDYDLMLGELMDDNGWDEETAREWLEVNTMTTLPYTGSMGPIIISQIKM